MQIKIEANESKEMRHNMINQFIGEYNEVQSEENSINKYKNALIWYLEYNRDLIASQNRKAEIKSLAEDCTEYDSPGQKLAAALCMHLEIEFSEGACLEQRTSKSIETKEPKVYPNPVTNTLYVKDVQGRAVEILSIEGTILYSVNNFQAERIDVSTLKNGIYILKVSGVDHVSTFKFIKIE
ncbi:MAG: T9SS type A sorting domain-containing protein [Saprospiraceae bacterium]|nr:T9SS type A sorting domain-containing protein [Saprospiraceae bacterium]